MEMLDFRTGELVEVGELVVKNSDGNLAIAKKACEIIEAAERTKKAIDEAYKKYRADLKEAMEEFGVDGIDTDGFIAAYKKGYWKSGGIDAKKLKARFPEAYETCAREQVFINPTVQVKLR